MNLKCSVAQCVLLVVLAATPAYPCDVFGPRPSPSDLVRQSDRIVVAKALAYTTNVPDPKYGANGLPEPRVRFQIIETLKGPAGVELVIPAFLTDVDDFNSEPPPSRGVRSFGRRVNCFADEYRQGGTFLLLLKAVAGDYTLRWAPLAPINEQVRPDNDVWVSWVRQQLQ